MTTATATPTKLRSGNWGARVTGRSVTEGDVVTITTRAGKTWQAEVVKVVWTDGSVAICATESLDRPTPTTPRPERGLDYCGYPCPVDGHRCTADRPCHDCL